MPLDQFAKDLLESGARRVEITYSGGAGRGRIEGIQAIGARSRQAVTQFELDALEARAVEALDRICPGWACGSPVTGLLSVQLLDGQALLTMQRRAGNT